MIIFLSFCNKSDNHIKWLIRSKYFINHLYRAYNARMNTDTLKLFIEVSQLGSFAAVARKLNLDPSSVSRSIALLEEQLGLRLFQRTTRQLVLTEAGELYLTRITPLLSEFDFALDEAHKVSQGPSGTLKMTASVAFGQVCLLPHIPEFRRLFPGIKLELQLTDSVVDLISQSIDLACRLAPKADSGLVGTRLVDTRYQVCISPDYFKTMPAIRQPRDLEDHSCVVFNLPEYRSKWTFKDNGGNTTSVPITSAVSISSALALKESALMGLGPVLLADWLVSDDIAHGKLIPLLTDYEVTAEDFDTAAWLLYPSRHFLPNKTRVMIDFLKSKFTN
jgi:DNA-binding transcriptional LysR family regulator